MPLIQDNIANSPWEKVGCDLFTLEGKDYLIVCDYFSNFFEIAELNRTNAALIIQMLKLNFARYGIPKLVISDNGP